MKKSLLIAASMLLSWTGFTANAAEKWSALDSDGWQITGCSEHNFGGNSKTDGGYAEILDGNASTFWHTSWTNPHCGHDANASNGYHYFVIDLGENPDDYDGFGYLPRQNEKGGNGYVTGYQFYALDNITGLATAGQRGDTGTHSIENNGHSSLTTFLSGKTPDAEGTFNYSHNVTSNRSESRVKLTEGVSNKRYALFVVTSSSGDTGFYANCAEFNLYKIEEAQPISVKCILKDGEHVVKEETLTDFDGTTTTITAPNYFLFADGQASNSFTINASQPEVTVSVAFTNDLPFAYTATTENMVWQGVRQHSNNHYWWQYTEDNSTTVAHQNTARHANNIPFEDSELYAFVGNIYDGFTVYNKAAGTAKPMHRNGGNMVIGATTDAGKFHPYYSSEITNRSQACCFKYGSESNYINPSSSTTLTSYRYNDAGSTCQFFSPVVPMTNYYNTNIAPLGDTKEGVVGYYLGQLPSQDAVNAAKATAEAEDATAEEIQAFAAANTAYVNSLEDVEAIRFDASKWYRFENVSFTNEYMVAAVPARADDPWIFKGGEEAPRSNANSLFAFRAVPDREGRYYITAQGSYMGKVTRSANVQQVAEDGDKAEFTLDRGIPGEYALSDATYTGQDGNNRLHHANRNAGDNIVGWNTITRNTFWYLHPATDLEVSLPVTEGEEHIGTGYFPFPVKATEGVKLYSISEGVSNTNPNEKVLVYAEVENVAAETPFLMIGSAATATLAIDYDGVNAAAMVAQPLVGNYRSTEPEDDVYVLNGKAFVKTTGASVGANSAYIPADNVSDATLESYSLVDTNSGTTGIEEIGAEAEGKTVIFDLQGRRLAAPVRGINIINGRKVLVK